jgi:transcriptional regulator with XRE-family HTH domain
MYREARNHAGLSIERAAEAIHCAPRTLCKYEARETRPSPEIALTMGRAYNAPALTMLYCRRECAIGQAYCYDVLNNVDLSPTGILTKYRHEAKEAHEALEQLTILLLNKHGKTDCTDAELKEIWQWSLEMLDLEHVIETLKLRLCDFLDVAALIEEHNDKCQKKKYVCMKKSDVLATHRTSRKKAI